MKTGVHAEAAAKKLLEKSQVESFPIDVEAIARGEGIQVAVSKLEGGVSGFLHRDGDRILIGVNSDHKVTKRRFTIAHELGHYMLHLGGPEVTFIDKIPSSASLVKTRRPDQDVDLREMEANAFAAALLMPEPLVNKQILSYMERYGSIEDIAWRMAKDFEVSEQAMTIRLIRLKVFE